MGALITGLNLNRADCTLRRTDIQNIIDSHRLWYSRFYIGAFAGYIVGALTGFIWLAAGVIGFYLGDKAPFWVALLAGLLLAPLPPLLGYAVRLGFPKMIFNFGASAKISTRAAYLRKTVGVGFILAVVTGIVAGVSVEKIMH